MGSCGIQAELMHFNGGMGQNSIWFWMKSSEPVCACFDDKSDDKASVVAGPGLEPGT